MCSGEGAEYYQQVVAEQCIGPKPHVELLSDRKVLAKHRGTQADELLMNSPPLD